MNDLQKAALEKFIIFLYKIIHYIHIYAFQ